MRLVTKHKPLVCVGVGEVGMGLSQRGVERTQGGRSQVKLVVWG